MADRRVRVACLLEPPRSRRVSIVLDDPTWWRVEALRDPGQHRAQVVVSLVRRGLAEVEDDQARMAQGTARAQARAERGES